jgi:uncharacterized protein (DUF433 family)
MRQFTRITVDPEQTGGVPCIRGLRIPVATVVGMLDEGMSESELLRAYPDLALDDIRESVRFAAVRRRLREGIQAIESGKFEAYEGSGGLQDLAGKVKARGRNRLARQTSRSVPEER